MRSKLVIGLLVGVIAFLLATNPVVSEAAGQITGRQIKNGSITGKDIKDDSITASDVSGSIAGPQGPAGPAGVSGAQGVPGTAGSNGTNGAPGLVRAWAAVDYTGDIKQHSTSPTVAVTHPDLGHYCVTVAGIASNATAASVTIDHSADSTSTGQNYNGTQSFAEVETKNFGTCPATATAQVDTYTRIYSNSGNNPPVTQLLADDNGFTILVP